MKRLEDLRFKCPYWQQTMTTDLKRLNRRTAKIDFDVFLPSRGKNLQRDFVWTLEQKRELVWSVLLKRRIPELSIINRWDDTLEVIDGKQRLSALIGFSKNEYTIDIEGKEYFFDELSKEYQDEITGYNIPYYEIIEMEDTIPDDFKVAWFKSINFAGTPQDREHLNSL